MIQLFNSLSKRKEKFVPLNKKRVGLYTCGPTVYDFAHIGNLRSYLLADILQRTLKFNGYKVLWVMNITDVDDKTIANSKDSESDKDPKKLLKELTQKYADLFWADLKEINVSLPNKRPTATDTIVAMQELIKNIFEAGFAYIKNGSVYFNVRDFSEKFRYGYLSKIDLQKMKVGARVDLDEYDKKNVQDFVLWKASKEDEPTWSFELDGQKLPGRPGWHIECSAMSKKYLGVPFDIHTGGVDLKFPHHENEIAQSIAGYGQPKLANFFLHNEHVLVNGKKMAKRFKNFFTLTEIKERGFWPLAYRYLVLQNHYNTPLNFTWPSLEAAQKALQGIHNQLRDILEEKEDRKSKEFKVSLQEFTTFINNDLDTPRALAFVHEMLNRKTLNPGVQKALLLEFDRVLGLGLNQIKPIKIPKRVVKMVKKREKARKEKDWTESDRLREAIEKAGFIVQDTQDGFEIREI